MDSNLHVSLRARSKKLFNRGGVNQDDFELISTIGEGAFSSVNLVKKVSGEDQGQYYAMKKQIVSSNQKEARRERLILSDELSIYDAIKGASFLAQLVYSFETDREVNFVLELYECGDLFELMKSAESFGEDEVRFCAAQLTLGIEELHSRKIVHRDIKPENILITTDGHLAITDFGLSYMFRGVESEILKESVGTLAFRAPEMLTTPPSYSYPVDWWGLGCVLFEMVTGENPFIGRFEEDSSYTGTVSRVTHSDPDIPINISLALKTFLFSLLDKDPETRLGSDGAFFVKDHCFFSDITWADVFEKNIESPWLGLTERQSLKKKTKKDNQEGQSKVQNEDSKNDQVKRKRPSETDERATKKGRSQ